MSNRRTAIFLTDVLGLAAGGRSETMFTRAEAMNKAGYDVVVAACGSRWNHLRTFNRLKDETGAENVIFENMFNWIAGTETQLVRKGEPFLMEEDQLFKIKVYPEETNNKKESNKRIYKEDQFDVGSDECSRTVYYNQVTEKPYAVVCYDNSDSSQEIATIYDLKHEKTFISMEDALSAWIAWLGRKYPDPVFFTEVEQFDSACMNNVYAETPIKTILICHSTMINEETSRPRRRARAFLRYPDKFVRLLFSEESDMPVIRALYGDIPNMGIAPETPEEWQKLMEDIRDDKGVEDRLPVMIDFSCISEEAPEGIKYRVNAELDETVNGAEFRMLIQDPEIGTFAESIAADRLTNEGMKWEMTFTSSDKEGMPYLEFIMDNRCTLYCLNTESSRQDEQEA